MTADADAVVFVSPSEAQSLIHQAVEAGFELSEETERRRFEETGTIRFCKWRFQIDLITASLPFEETAYRPASFHELFGIRLRFPSPEDLDSIQNSGRPRQGHFGRDARRHAGRLDVAYLEQTLQTIRELAEDASLWNRLQKVLARP